jgi:hypothetical protein
MDTKSIECFGIDPRSRGLRVELSPQESLVFAHEHFMHSEWKAGAEHDTLKIYFINHEVTLIGYGLRRVETAMHTREIAWVVAAPARYRSQGKEKGFITQISVRRLDDEDAAAGTKTGD